ncbi:MAG: hypothetical protein ACYC9K_01030 [Sulfuricaulis sp.]
MCNYIALARQFARLTAHDDEQAEQVRAILREYDEGAMEHQDAVLRLIQTFPWVKEASHA